MIPTLLTDSVSSDLGRAVHYALLWGLEAVELRSIGGPMNRVPNVNEQKVRRRLVENDLPALAVVPNLFEGEIADRAGWLNDLATLDETLQFCARLNCPRIIVSSFLGVATDAAVESAADALRRAGDRTARMNIELCVLNSEGGMASTGDVLAQLLEAAGHDAIRAAWDPAAAAMAGENPTRALDALATNVGYVRCRNVGESGNGWEPRAIDKGAVDWQIQLARLKEAGFDGPVSLEVALEPRAKTGLHDATALIRLIRSLGR